MHNDTAYGLIPDGDGGFKRDAKGQYLVVTRKALADLDWNKLADIKDDGLRHRLQKLADDIRHDASVPDKEKWALFLREADAQTRIQGGADADRIAQSGTKRVKVVTVLGAESLAFIAHDKSGAAPRQLGNRQGRFYKAYKTDGNAYMDVWLLPGDKVKGETVSRYAAHQPGHQSIIRLDCPTAKKLMRLQVNDMVARGTGDDRQIYKVKSLTGQKIVMIPHQEADFSTRLRDKKHPAYLMPTTLSAGKILKEGLRKISVSPDGVLRDTGPLKPRPVAQPGMGKAS